MKIAIFSDNFYPEISGISDSILLIAEGLAKKGHEICFYVPHYSKKDFSVVGLPPIKPSLHPNITLFRLPSLPCPNTPTKQGRFVLPIFSSFFHLQKFHPDIIYSQDFFTAGFEALLLSKIFRKPLVGTSHTHVTEFLKYTPLRAKWFEKIILRYVSWYYNQCRFITAPSQSILLNMKKNGFKKEGIVISNPIDNSQFSPTTPEKKKKLKIQFSLSSRTLLYTGRLAEEKNIDQIIHALSLVHAIFPDVTLAITGKGSTEDSLKKLVRELGLENHVFFFGYKKKKDLIKLYQASDIFVVMSTAETQCMSMMQAMAAGIPVIGADAWGLPEYIGSKNGLLIQPGNIKDLAENILSLFKNPKQMHLMGENGLYTVSEFSPEKITNQWEKKLQNELPQDLSRHTLSIIVPAYNEEGYIGNCLSAILKEVKNSRKNVEVIVVNNASTDRTKKIALTYPGVTVVDEFRKGLPRARQAGFEASSGTLIANVDADTQMPLGWIEKVFTEFSKDPRIVALSGPCLYYDRSSINNLLIRAYYGVGYLFYLFTGALIQGGNFVLKREALEKISGFNTDIDFYGEDTDIARRIQKIGRVKFSFSFSMKTSARRFSQEGFFSTTILYILNYFCILLFKKPFKHPYTYVGETTGKIKK